MVSQVCIIGAGFSGLCLALRLVKDLNSRDFVIFDQNTDVGGMWLTNTYPGCGSDTPGHLYCYSFEQKTDWKSTYPTQSEVIEYLKKVVTKYGLYDHIRFRRTVQSLTWLESHKKWKAVVLDMDKNAVQEYLFPLVVVAVGQFQYPNFPQEFLNFRGPVIHTSRWDPSCDLQDKTVAVVGSGASAVQLIPEIQENVKRLICYQRRPAWVLSKKDCSNMSLRKWWCCPLLPSLYRSFLFLKGEASHIAYRRRTFLGQIGSSIGSTLGYLNLRSQTKHNRKLNRLLRPTVKFGCHKPCFSNTYYSALTQPNVTVIRSKIFSIKGNRIMTDGGDTRKVDAVILATGFRRHEYLSPLQIFVDSFKDVSDTWKETGPSAYLGTFFKGLPNMFLMHGPGSDVVHNSRIFVFECQAEMIMKVLRQMKKKFAKKLCIRNSVVDDYMRIRECKIRNTVWAEPECQSDQNNENDPGNNWKQTSAFMFPETLTSFWLMTRRFNPDKLFHYS